MFISYDKLLKIKAKMFLDNKIFLMIFKISKIQFKIMLPFALVCTVWPLNIKGNVLLNVYFNT